MARKFSALIAALALGGGLAYAEDKPDERPGTDTREKGGVTDTKEGTSPSNPGTGGSMSPASPTSPPADQEEATRGATKETSGLDAQGIVAKVHDINQLEIRLGKMAKKKARNKSVKAYGAMLQREHAKIDRELSSLARKLKVTMTKPDGKTEADKEEGKSAAELEERLKTARGGQFDAMFLTGMITGHTEAIDVVTKAREKATDARLRSFLDKTLPKLKAHRTKAQQILDKLKATS